MTNENILKKAIEKAEKNGYKIPFPITKAMAYYLIYDHSFAKAFWGEKINTIKGKDLANYLQFDYTHDENCRDNQFMFKTWQGRLIIMALQKEPLKYLEKFL